MKNKVLIAVDISESTAEVIQKGIDFASKMNASIVIASIIPIYVDYLQSQMALVPTQWDEIYTAQKEYAIKELQKIKEDYNYLDITLYVEVGNAKYDIIDKAEKEERSVENAYATVVNMLDSLKVLATEDPHVVKGFFDALDEIRKIAKS